MPFGPSVDLTRSAIATAPTKEAWQIHNGNTWAPLEYDGATHEAIDGSR